VSNDAGIAIFSCAVTGHADATKQTINANESSDLIRNMVHLLSVMSCFDHHPNQTRGDDADERPLSHAATGLREGHRDLLMNLGSIRGESYGLVLDCRVQARRTPGSASWSRRQR
jgi:hypothetical protein